MEINDYGCEICGECKLLDDIVWVTSSYGVCKECYDKLSNNELEELYKKYE